MKAFFYLLILGGAFLEAVADVLFKMSQSGHKPSYLYIGLGLYMVGTLIWAASLRFEFLSKAVVIFGVVNIILVILAGALILGESISFSAKIGMCLGIAAIVLMNL